MGDGSLLFFNQMLQILYSLRHIGREIIWDPPSDVPQGEGPLSLALGLMQFRAYWLRG